MPPMQKRALYEFIANLILLVVLVPVIIFGTKGISDTGQLLFLVILIVTPSGLAYWIPRYLTRPRPDQPVVLDERDRAVLSHVPKYQFAGVLLTIGVWVVVLVTVYNYRGQVPVGFLWLVWLSVLIANGIFTTAGVMVEYRRAGTSAEAEKDPDYYLIGGLSRGWLFNIAMGLGVVALIAAVILSGFDSGSSGPRADFTSDVTVVHVGDPIQFSDATERRDSTSSGEAAAQRWEFGDCTWSDERNPLHAFANPGRYTVHLTVFYPSGAELFATKEDYITVLPAESP